MTIATPKISGSHKTVLLHEVLQAIIVLTVVMASTVLSVIKPQVISSDLPSFVYGGALPSPARKAPQPRHAPARAAAAGHPARRHPVATIALTEAERYQADYVSIGRQEGADELAILAALCAGYGENNWNAHTCNSGGYCGT